MESSGSDSSSGMEAGEKLRKLARLVVAWSMLDTLVSDLGWDGGDNDEKWDKAKHDMVGMAKEVLAEYENDKTEEWTPVEFAPGPAGEECEKAFRARCEDPGFVASCLRRYQRWRRGEGEYAVAEDPEKHLPMPFCPRALSIVEDAAIKFTEGYDAYDLCIAQKIWEKK